MEDSSQLRKRDQLEIWDELHEKQSNIFKTTISRNAELEIRNEELEQELGVWKTALRESENEKKRLARSVSQLQRNVDDNPLILCLIDGDGNIFSPDLIVHGNPGGRQAAVMLTKGIMDYLQSADNSLAGRAQIWLTIYCNLPGLLDTLIKNGICTVDQYIAFVMGFNQSSPLFSLVDVGPVKEAADSKLKESLRVFTRFPQILKVFFGGGHDNGYSSTLNYLQTEGLLHKIVLLRGYKDIAYDLRNLNMPDIEIEGVFMTHKMQTNPYRKQSAGLMTVVQPQDFDRFRSHHITPSPPPPLPRNSSPAKNNKYVDLSQPLHKQKPPPCNFYYLSECRQGSKCHFGHDYFLTDDQVDELRRNAKKWPCPIANKGQTCIQGDDCVMGHFCPRGSKCTFAKQGRCKYTAKNMHPPLIDTPQPQYSSYASADGAFDGYKLVSRRSTNVSETDSASVHSFLGLV